MTNSDASKKIDTEQFLESIRKKSSFDEQYARIKKILGCTSDEGMEVSDKNLKIYHRYLKKNLEMPCHLTGIEDFQWEERYVFGYGDPDEYKKLKKKQPSYTDTYNLIDYEIDGRHIYVKVQRLSDKKKFDLPLDELESVDRKSKNYSILHDYSVWHVNS